MVRYPKFWPVRVIQRVEESHCNRPVADGERCLRGCRERGRGVSRPRPGGAAMRELSRHRRNQCEPQPARTAVSKSLQAISGRRFAARVPESSEERRVGKECVSTCRSRCSPSQSKKKMPKKRDQQ